jgi:hypothetical protein
VWGIICSDETANATNAGTVRAYIIELGRIINDRASLFEVCDAHSQTVHDYSCVLVDFKNGGLKPSIEKQFRVIGARDILILDREAFVPAFIDAFQVSDWSRYSNGDDWPQGATSSFQHYC